MGLTQASIIREGENVFWTLDNHGIVYPKRERTLSRLDVQPKETIVGRRENKLISSLGLGKYNCEKENLGLRTAELRISLLFDT